MSRELRLRRSARSAASLISLALGTGCLMLVAQSAADWAALAARYSEAANRGGLCAEGASSAAEAGSAAGRAKDAANDADAALGGGLARPADIQVLARVRQLADAAVPAYNAALEPLRSALADQENASEELGAELGLLALSPFSWPAAIADAFVCGSQGGTQSGADCGHAELYETVEDGLDGDLAIARARLDTVLGMLEAAELELLQMHRAMDPNGEASTAALDAVQALRRKVAVEGVPEFYASSGSTAESSAFGVLNRAATEVQQLIIGLQRTVVTEAAQIAGVERAAGSAGTRVHNAEETAREEAENARVAAEAALSACGVAVDWDLGDPLDATFDQELSNQSDYTVPAPGPAPGP